jgi:chloramphenicol 3-O-phosphotransferase
MCAAARASTVIRVIIWLNGTFGVGKTSAAERLTAMVPDSRVFDPEIVGQLLRETLIDRPVGDFQDYPAWRPMVAAALIEIARMTGQHVIVPQAVLQRDYLEQMLALLRAAELDVFHVVLDASDDVLRRRIEGSGDNLDWRLSHLDEYDTARPWMTELADLVVDTAASTPPQNARRIAAAIPVRPDLGADPGLAPEAAPAKPAAAAARPAPAATPAPASPAPASTVPARPAAKAGLSAKSRVAGAPADRR